ncbi:MAG: glycosyltransferase [Deltaproteobacteria bacterium]|nr:glycosyltransferase [Deltaproteobacteria bacterium]
MKIAYVSREYGPITGGGIGTYIGNVVREMSQRGHEIFLVTDCVSDFNSHLVPPGVRVIPVVPTSPPRSGNFFTSNQEYSYQVLDTLCGLARETTLDIIEFAEYGGEGFAAIRSKRLMNRFAHTALVVKCHTPLSLLFEINEDRRLFVETVCDISLEDYCIRNADLVTSPSRSLADYFSERVGRKDIRICPYPMRLPASHQPRTFSHEQIRRVRFVGSIQVRKGIDVFIEAAKIVLEKHPDFLFELWGKVRNATYFGNDYRKILERQIPNSLRDRIIFRGDIPYDKINDLFLDSCIVAFPSRWENWANVCLEAISQGCVVFASRLGGMAEMIDDGIHGILIDPLDPEQLAEHILALTDDPHRLETISRVAIERSKAICDPIKACEAIEANYAAVPQKRAWRPVEGLPLVSVIIPHYNQGKYLQEAVESVRVSTYANIETIVVDDGSTDDHSRQIFEQLPGVTKIRKPNGGLSSARNAGIDVAQGEYFLPLDADDRIHPDYIRAAVAALENNPYLGYVSCHAQNFGDSDAAYIPIGYVPPLMVAINTDGKCANLFRRELHTRRRRYDETMVSYEDWEFLIQLHASGIEGDVLPDEFFFYRRHDDSMVYQTANPLRADLIQYMMTKHRAIFTPHAPLLAIVLARLWKEQEMRAESDVAKVYWTTNSDYTELASTKQIYPLGKRAQICLRFESKADILRLRFDPGEQQGSYFISNLVVCDAGTRRILWACSGMGGSCCGAGDTNCVVFRGALLVQSQAGDPQVLLPEMSSHGCRMFELSCTIVGGLCVEAELARLKLLLETDEKSNRTRGRQGILNRLKKR